MKFLQTGDLHLGKLFFEYSLLPDQDFVLKSLIQELKTAYTSGVPYDALALCGDIYDRALPPVDAVRLFSLFLAQVKAASPEIHILIIPGNHDSALRISYASEILEYQDIHIRTTTDSIEKPVIIAGTAFYLLPFLAPGISGESESQQTQEAMTKTAIDRIKAAMKDSDPMPSVLCAHLFTTGSKTSDSERAIWGTAEQVDASLFSPFTYTACGHLHRYQKAGKNVYYAGSPLTYSFDESNTEKCFLKVEIPPTVQDELVFKTFSVDKIPVTPLHPVAALSGKFSDFLNSNQYDMYSDYYLEISSTDFSIVENPLMLLRPKFPFLLTFKQEKAVSNISTVDFNQRRTAISDSDGNITEQFGVFLLEIAGDTDSAAQKAEQELFSQLWKEQEEQNHETN